MFGIGYLELMVLGLLVILLFPPRELPKLARMAARAYGQVRRIADEFHRTVLLDEELRAPIDEIRGAYDEARWDIRRAGDRLKKEVSSVNDGMKQALSAKPSEGADSDHDHFDEELEDPMNHHEAYPEDDFGHEEEDFENEHPPGAFESSADVPPRDPSTAQDTGAEPSPIADEPGTAPLRPARTTRPFIPAIQSNDASPERESTYLPGRVAATDAAVPGASMPRPPQLPPTAPREPAAPRRAMPQAESDEIDDSALTRVSRLPMPPSLKESQDPPADAPNPKGAPHPS